MGQRHIAQEQTVQQESTQYKTVQYQTSQQQKEQEDFIPINVYPQPMTFMPRTPPHHADDTMTDYQVNYDDSNAQLDNASDFAFNDSFSKTIEQYPHSFAAIPAPHESQKPWQVSTTAVHFAPRTPEYHQEEEEEHTDAVSTTTSHYSPSDSTIIDRLTTAHEQQYPMESVTHDDKYHRNRAIGHYASYPVTSNYSHSFTLDSDESGPMESG